VLVTVYPNSVVRQEQIWRLALSGLSCQNFAERGAFLFTPANDHSAPQKLLSGSFCPAQAFCWRGRGQLHTMVARTPSFVANSAARAVSQRGYNMPGRNSERRLMILPETMNTPSPV
jgi:hypothetical protein